ncbi:glycosyltransferase [uncultured Erythrobacter sp.]|uniref:glycosyltransferase n=1 Tax=uncultured Erythrobacter sp. TaxID=263913 RepID=UPI0026379D22|nr:glycosyltransferase [uncultured Erythrobacter sp.]
MKSKIIILDPDCRDAKSHNLMASLRAALAAKASGFAVDAIINRAFPESDKTLDDVCGEVVRAWPSFAFVERDDELSSNLIKFHPVYNGGFSPWEQYLFSLLQLHDEGRINADTKIFIHTASVPMLMGVLQYLLTLSSDQRPQFFCLIYCQPEIIQGERLQGVPNLDILQRLKDEGLIGSHIFFHVETIGLQEHYSSLGFAFPIAMGPLDPFSSPGSGCGVDGKKIVSYLGEARAEKGFQHLPDIIEALGQQGGVYDVEFRIQTYSNPANDTFEIHTAKRRLERLQVPGVTITLLADLAPEEFSSEMEKADVVVMPYDIEHYAARGSGIAYDALTSRTRIVCTPGADIERTFSSCGVDVPLGDTPEEFAAAISRALFDEALQDLSYLEDFTVESFFSTLFKVHDLSEVKPSRSAAQARAVNALVLPMNGGHAFVQNAQLKVLRCLNIDSILLGIPWVTEIDGFEYYKGELIKDYFSSGDYIGHSLAFMQVKRSDEFRIRFALHKSGKIDYYYFSNFTDIIRDYVELGPLIEMMLKVSPVDKGIVNYPWLDPIIDDLRAANESREVRFVCEVHDNQCQQNFLRRAAHAESHGLEWSTEKIKSDSETELAAELESLSRFDRRIFISTALKDQLTLPDSGRDQVVFPPNVQLREAVENQDDNRVVEEAEEYLFEEVEILFVGTAHQANRTSLQFLMDDVMPLVRRTQQATLFVVGSIERMFSSEIKQSYASQGIHFLGHVADINQWYDAAQVVALAVTEGTGFPTKVIETMALGKSFSVTRGALYELAADTRDLFPVCDTADEMAADIVELLSSRELRETRGAAARQFYDINFSLRKYASQWSQALGVNAVGDFSEPHRRHVEVNLPIELMPKQVRERNGRDISATDSQDLDSDDHQSTISEDGHFEKVGAKWLLAETRDLEGMSFVNLQVSSFAVERGRYLSDFHVKLVRVRGKVGLELREDDGAFQLIGEPNDGYVEADRWGRVVRVFADESGANEGSTISSVSENTAYLREFLFQLPMGIKACDFDHQQDWREVAEVLSKLAAVEEQALPQEPSSWLKWLGALLMPGARSGDVGTISKN